LNIRAFYDTSILEVYINDRAAITTRIYAATNECSGLAFFAEGHGVSHETELAEIVECQVWDGLTNE